MAVDNKTIEKEKSTSFYIILVERDGVKKYISKDFFSSCFPCTVLLNKAKRFSSEELANRFINNSLSSRKNMKVIKPMKVVDTLELCE